MREPRLFVECPDDAPWGPSVFNVGEFRIREVPFGEAAERMRAAYLRFAGQDDLWRYLLLAALGEDTV